MNDVVMLCYDLLMSVLVVFDIAANEGRNGWCKVGVVASAGGPKLEKSPVFLVSGRISDSLLVENHCANVSSCGIESL